jgi:hypothetical protein
LYGWCTPPAAWLGLSQLHTLRGVSLSNVPAATVAAALPRLHTLHLDHGRSYLNFPVDAFYAELLPRLRSFHFEGVWPETSDGTKVDALPLPLLEDLTWRGLSYLPRQFMGARPSTLNTDGVDLVAWLKASDGVGADSATATAPVARLQALTLRIAGTPPAPAFLTRLLRAAPHLRQLTFDVRGSTDMRWVLSDVPAYAGLAHPELRHVALVSMHSEPVPDGCGVRLRQRHFPRLRRLTVDDEEYSVWVPQRVPRSST